MMFTAEVQRTQRYKVEKDIPVARRIDLTGTSRGSRMRFLP
jgi:hypothetical protein